MSRMLSGLPSACTSRQNFSWSTCRQRSLVTVVEEERNVDVRLPHCRLDCCTTGRVHGLFLYVVWSVDPSSNNWGGFHHPPKNCVSSDLVSLVKCIWSAKMCAGSSWTSSRRFSKSFACNNLYHLSSKGASECREECTGSSCVSFWECMLRGVWRYSEFGSSLNVALPFPRFPLNE